MNLDQDDINALLNAAEDDAGALNAEAAPAAADAGQESIVDIPTPLADPGPPVSAPKTVLPSGGESTSPRRDQALLNIPLTLTVVLAERRMSVSSALEVTSGTIIEFEKVFDEMLDLYAGNRLIARGQAVKVGENFGLRIVDGRNGTDG